MRAYWRLVVILLGAVVALYRWRGRLALHVLRGRPLAYRVTLRGQNVGMNITSPNTMVVECTIINDPPPGPSFEFERDALGVETPFDPDDIDRWFL